MNLVAVDTITDEQIRELRDANGNSVEFKSTCNLALLGLAFPKQEVRDARARCAEVFNVRAKNPSMGGEDL